MFGFGYYEGYRNTSGKTQNIVVLTRRAAARQLSASTPIRDPLTGAAVPGQHHSRRADQPVGAEAARRLRAAAERRSGNRYIASPDAIDDRDQIGLRFDYQLSAEALAARPLPAQPTTDVDHAADDAGRSATVAKATLQDVMASDTYIFTPQRDQRGAASRSTGSARTPQATSGLSNTRLRHQRAEHERADRRRASPRSPSPASSASATRSSRSSSRVNEVSQFTDDLTWVTGRHSVKFGADIRREHMIIDFINRPNGDFTFTGRPRADAATRLADFLLGLPRSSAGRRPNAAQDGTGWLYSGYAQDEFRPSRA